MATQSTELSAALATLRSRWGAAAPGYAGEVIGALATVPLPAEPDADPHGREGPGPSPAIADPARIFCTGFAELDAILGPGGVPRGMGVSMRGDASSGRTTLALRLAAEAQAAGGIVAWLDLTAALDPVEAVARGIDPAWLVVVTPADPDEGLAIAGSLLSGRAVDLLVIDLPSRVPRAKGGKAPAFADRLGRLAALARRAGITLLVLEPARISESVAGAVGEATGIRLELSRRSWIRLGRDVVGQRTEVVVARNRAGPPGRRATLRILYADGGPRDACLRRERLFAPWPDQPATTAPAISVPEKRNHATPSSSSPTSPPRPREAAPALRVLAGGAGRARGKALDERDRARRGSGRPGARRPARDAAGLGASIGAGGDLPRRATRG